MLETNPFSLLSEVVPTVVMQGFMIAMVLLIAFGTIIQMIHHKNLTYSLTMQKKQNCRQQERLELLRRQKLLLRLLYMLSLIHI